MSTGARGSLVGALTTKLHKLTWGVRAVGVRHTALGATRLAMLAVRRPARSEVRLRSGGLVSFENPSQRAPALVVFGDVIDPELILLRRVLAPDSVLIDAGAAIGQFTVVAGQTPGTTIHAYEPSAANLESLRRNVALNGLTERTVVHQAALSSSEGTATFRTTANSFLSGLDDRGTKGPDGDIETVPVHTLTSELSRLGLEQVDVLKVNVAGYEAPVLEGAMPVLERGGVDLLIVLIGSEVVPVLQRIAGLGYRFFFFDPYSVALHELDRVDMDTLNRPPTPARHVIAIRPHALASGALATIPVSRRGATHG